MNNYLIYHKSCLDGFTSAYIGWKHMGDNCTYIPLSYYDSIPKIKNSNLFVCDFSFDHDTTVKLIKDNKFFINIDHHKTACEKLTEIDDKYKKFDQSHCGAYLTWKYFFPKKKIPQFIKYIEDYDLWQFKYPETKPFTIALNEIRFNFKEWERLEDPEYLEELIEKGKILQSYQNSLVNLISYSKNIKLQKIDNKEFKIAYVNTNLLKNEVANKIVSESDCDFCVAYNYDDRKDVTKFSLRSTDTKADVSKVVKILGGGGHRNAAGLTINGFHNSII